MYKTPGERICFTSMSGGTGLYIGFAISGVTIAVKEGLGLDTLSLDLFQRAVYNPLHLLFDIGVISGLLACYYEARFKGKDNLLFHRRRTL